MGTTVATGRRRLRHARRSGRPLATAALFALSLVATVAQAPPAHAAAKVLSDVQYGEDRGRKLLMDVYLPQSQGSGRPGVIMIHGGGWYRGDKSLWQTEGADLAGIGMVGFAINYNMNEPRWPGEFNDVQMAIKWVRDHASDYGVNPAKLGVIGSSAGAHLGDLAGVEGEGPLDAGSRVAAVVSWSAPFDLTQIATNPMGPPEDGCVGSQAPVCSNRQRISEVAIQFLGCQPSACPQTYRDASPIDHVDKTDPPILIANSDMELMPLQQAQEAQAAFQAKGVPVKLDVVPGHRHASQYSDYIWADTVQWLQQYLSGKGGGGETTAPPTSVPTNPESPPATLSIPPDATTPASSSFPIVPVVIGVVVVVAIAVVAALTARRRRPYRR